MAEDRLSETNKKQNQDKNLTKNNRNPADSNLVKLIKKKILITSNMEKKGTFLSLQRTEKEIKLETETINRNKK